MPSIADNSPPSGRDSPHFASINDYADKVNGLKKLKLSFARSRWIIPVSEKFSTRS
jgi:hypothetical protein